MEPVHILVNSRQPAIGETLQGALPPPEYDVVSTEPGRPFLEAVARAFPDIAIVDFRAGRETTAELEVELLRTIRPDMRIIRVRHAS